MFGQHFLEPALCDVLQRRGLGHLREADTAQCRGELRGNVVDDQGTRHRKLQRLTVPLVDIRGDATLKERILDGVEWHLDVEGCRSR